MSISRRSTLLLLAGTAPAMMLANTAFAAGTTLKVSLWDKGPDSMLDMDTVKPMGMAMGGDMSMATMGITASETTVPAGEVTFEVSNDSAETIHEMVVAPVKDMNTQLPYVEDLQKVDEDAAGHLGEVAELDPAGTGALTLTLAPGTYILYCNIPTHYALGMWTTITVV